MTSTAPTLHLIEPGDIVEVRNRWNEKSNTRINRVYEVRIDDEVIGYVKRLMITRERRVKGARYVLARWQSPGWKYFQKLNATTGFECTSAKDGARSLAWVHARNPR